MAKKNPKRTHRIKEALKEKNKSSYWLSNETGLTLNTVYRYVNGKGDPTLTNLFRIAEALEISPKDLLNCS